jgi:hypothetical protein
VFDLRNNLEYHSKKSASAVMASAEKTGKFSRQKENDLRAAAERHYTENYGAQEKIQRHLTPR